MCCTFKTKIYIIKFIHSCASGAAIYKILIFNYLYCSTKESFGQKHSELENLNLHN